MLVPPVHGGQVRNDSGCHCSQFLDVARWPLKMVKLLNIYPKLCKELKKLPKIVQRTKKVTENTPATFLKTDQPEILLNQTR